MKPNTIKKSKKLLSRASKILVGGVNSPVRSFNSVGGNPIFVSSGKGAILNDADNNSYIDFCMSWGAQILGHANSKVNRAVNLQLAKGVGFGTSTALELELANLIQKQFKNFELIRFVNSGTEAVMTAIRLARAATNRSMIIKFNGHYHGHSDGLLVKAGSGLATSGIASSKGVPNSYVADTCSMPFNSIEKVEALLKTERVACVILEPIAGNMGLIPAKKGFIKALRSLTRKYGTLLIFDEVMSGFRVGRGGATALYGVYPDITTLGKVIGGGFPVGAIGGKKKIMSLLAPVGNVYQAGTLSGNPVAMTAGIETLKVINDSSFYPSFNKCAMKFYKPLKRMCANASSPINLRYSGGMFCLFFQKNNPMSFEGISEEHVERYNKFFHFMLNRGIYFPPSAFEACFLSKAHSKAHFNKVLLAIKHYLEDEDV